MGHANVSLTISVVKIQESKLKQNNVSGQARQSS